MARSAERPSADSIHRLFELSLDMLGTASAEGYFTRLNPAWEGALGWSREELMAEPFISFIHPDDVEATMREAARLGSPGGPAIVGFENRYRTRDGGYRNIEWAGVADDGVYYFAATDVTERHEARAAQPPLRGAAADADGQPAGHQRVPHRSRPADPDRRRRDDEAAVVARREHVPRAQADRARRGPRRRARAVAEALPGRPGRGRREPSSSSARD